MRKIGINPVIFCMASILLLSGVVLGFTLSDCCPPAFFYISDIDVWGLGQAGGTQMSVAGQEDRLGWTKTKLLILGRSDQGVNSLNTGQTLPTFINRKLLDLIHWFLLTQR